MGDAVVVARALAALPDRLHGFALARMLAEADAANRWRQRYRAPHPRWGDGTLTAVALRRPVVPEPVLEDLRFRLCLIRVLSAII